MKGKSGQKVQNESLFFRFLKTQSLIILVFQVRKGEQCSPRIYFFIQALCIHACPWQHPQYSKRL